MRERYGVSRGGLLYGAVVGAHLASLFVAWVPTGVTKLLIAPALAYAVWRAAGRLPLLYAGALLASWVGDYSMWVADDGLSGAYRAYFTAGVVAFGVAHGCYVWLAVVALARRRKARGQRAGGRLTAKPVTTALFVASATVAVVVGVPYLLALYGLLLAWLVALTGALARHPAAAGGDDVDAGVFAAGAPAGGYGAAFAGALAFAVSDGLIGLQLAGALPVGRPWSTALIMGLYAGGQWGLRSLAAGRGR